MKVLVTGNRGYVGSVLVPHLLERGHEVTGLDVDLYRRCSYGVEPVPVPTLARDVRDVTAKDLSGQDAVIHLAALSNDPLGELNPDVTWDINHRGTVRCARAARQAGVRRFLFASTCSNYGAGGEEAVDEDAPLHPLTAYAQSKVEAEQDLRALEDEDFEVVRLRFATAYGLSPRHRFDIVLNNLAAWAHATGRIHLKSDGSPWRPLIHVEDMARAFAAVLEAPSEAVAGRAFNVAPPGSNHRIRELAELLAELRPDCRVELAADASPDARNYKVSGERIARSVPAFVPRWDVRRGAEQLLAAYARHGLKLEDFEGPVYKRIDHVRWLMSQGLLDEGLRWTAAGEKV